jgi:hypothetical protein
MIYKFALAITFFAINLSLNSMERSKKLLKKAASHNPLSSDKNKKKSTTKKPTVPVSTFFKGLPCLSLLCKESGLPKELEQHMQVIYYATETEKLEKSGKFFENWKKFNLKTLDYHLLKPEGLYIIEDLFASNPHQLSSKDSYDKFVKTMPLSIKTTLAIKFPKGIPVTSESAKNTDFQMQMLGIQSNQSFGTSYRPIFTRQEKKALEQKQRTQLIDTKKRQ